MPIIKKVLPDLTLKEILEEKERVYHGKDDIFGMTLLTNPGYISASRNIMFTSHLRQFVNLNKPDFPKVFTNYENIVGKHSTGYHKAKHKLKVVDKIPRFADIDTNHLYLMFFYDEKRDSYSVLQKKIVEDLTEKFGFKYKNTVIDSKEIHDTVDKGETLYSSTSYDDDGNYNYGKNIKSMYLLENNTIEDAILCSQSLSESLTSTEVETVKISLNDNDILCNIYGNSDEYRGFPDINENVKDKIICAKRRIHNSQLLFDLKKSNLRKINFMSDIPFFIDGTVIDITIYSNKPISEIEDNTFNRQLIKYLKMQMEFYTKVYERCKQIIESGSKYSPEVNFYYKKAKNILDDKCMYKEEDNSVFSNMVIEFLVKREVPLSVGQKITGRYGNKGVVSKVCPDDEMPFLETGERVDVIFNTLGVINRLNSFQLYEQSINFICNRICERISITEDIGVKEQMVFSIIKHFNVNQEKRLREYYNSLPQSKKEDFFDDAVKKGLFIHIPPLWEDVSLFDKLRAIYAEFDWIKPYGVYVHRFGRKIRMMKDLIVGDMYIIKLNQTSKKGFSVRATGSLSKRGVPEKSNRAKTHQELYPHTPIRIGDQENINSIIGVDPDIIAQLHLFYRSSVVGRRDLGQTLATKLNVMKSFKYSPEFKNRNVEILQAYLKAMGLKIVFADEKLYIDIYTDRLEEFSCNDKMYICTKAEFETIEREAEVRREFREDKCLVGTHDEVESAIRGRIKEIETNESKYVINVNI